VTNSPGRRNIKSPVVGGRKGKPRWGGEKKGTRYGTGDQKRLRSEGDENQVASGLRALKRKQNGTLKRDRKGLDLTHREGRVICSAG